MQHRDRGAAARDRAQRRDDADRLGAILDWPAGLRIQDVAIALAVALEETLVIAAGREPALAQFQLRDRRMRNARMFDADPPRTAVGVRPDDPDVAPTGLAWKPWAQGLPARFSSLKISRKCAGTS